MCVNMPSHRFIIIPIVHCTHPGFSTSVLLILWPCITFSMHTHLGFLYTGDLLHEFVAATQFIAPLQADFNPSKNESGRVLILSTGER